MDFEYSQKTKDLLKRLNAFFDEHIYPNEQRHIEQAEQLYVWLKKLGPRCLLVHLKDMSEGGERKFAPVGEGILDFAQILKASRDAGVKWGIVEQDSTYDVPPLDAVRRSFENLRKLGGV